MRALLALLLVVPWGATAERVSVFAAASLREALQEVADGYQPAAVLLTCGSSATLAKQLLAGAPGEAFCSADEAWMDTLAAADAIVPESRRLLLGNRLVLIAPRDRPRSVTLDGPLPEFPGRLALADPASVPAGRYARAALERLGWWPALAGRLAPTMDVRAALRLVETGEADLGVVYATDAQASRRVQVVAVVPADLHPPIRYPVALTRAAGPAARDFLIHLGGATAAAIFRRHGFIVLEP